MLNMNVLPADEQQNLRDIFSGKALPPLSSDVIAKRILNADVHPDRLNYLMRSIARDPTIDVSTSVGQESFQQSIFAKSMITDIPSWLKDGRLADLEMQVAKQDFIFTRIELYASDMLLLQYSVSEGQLKSEVDSRNVREVLIIVLMVESPKAFRAYDKKCEKYIHRFTRMNADTGLSYPLRAKMIYVQLDKCLKQYKEGRNAETGDGRPDQLQLWLSMFADVNDETVKTAAEKDEDLVKIIQEASDMALDKEVQNMLLQEKYVRMDWATQRHQAWDEGRDEGRDEGLDEGIAGTVKALRDFGVEDKRIAEKLKEIYSLTDENVEKFMSKQQAL